MRGSQGGRHAIRGYLAQILISVMKTLREDNTWDEFEIESEKEDKVDLKYNFSDPKKDLAIQVKQSINEINDTNAKKWAEELKNDVPNAVCELHLVSYTSKEVIKMKSHMDVSIISHLVNFQELRETANNRLNNYIVQLGYERTNPKFISIVLKALITDFFFWAITGKSISRKDFNDKIKLYMSFDKPDLILKEAKMLDVNLKLKDHVQNTFNAIRDKLKKIMIKEDKLADFGKKDYHFILKQRVNHEATDDAFLKEFQNNFYSYIRSIKEDWKYFGINGEGDISFCYGRYVFLNKLIRCASVLSIHKTELINKIITDMKEICKNHYQIELI